MGTGPFQLLVERTVPAQHAVDDIGGDAADGEARRVACLADGGGAGVSWLAIHGRASIPDHGRLQASLECAN